MREFVYRNRLVRVIDEEKELAIAFSVPDDPDEDLTQIVDEGTTHNVLTRIDELIAQEGG